MRKAIFALLVGAFGACDAGANCGGCAPPRSSVVAAQDAGVHLTFAPIEPSPAPPSTPPVVPPPRAAIVDTPDAALVTSPPPRRTRPHATEVDAAPPDAAPPMASRAPTMEHASSLDEPDAGVDASMLDSGEGETGSLEDAAPE